MSRITLKFFKYFFITISSIVLICFLLSSLFLSKLYLDQQYSSLSTQGDLIIESYEKNDDYYNNDYTGVLVDVETNSSIWWTQNISNTIGGMSKMKTRGSNYFIHFDYSTLAVIYNAFIWAAENKQNVEPLHLLLMLLKDKKVAAACSKIDVKTDSLAQKLNSVILEKIPAIN